MIRVITTSTCLAGFLLAASFACGADQPTWRVGTAEAKITPRDLMWMGGFAARTKPAEGTLDDLWVKALVIEAPDSGVGVLVTLDLVGIPKWLYENLCRELSRRHGLTRSQLRFAASHTHSGPVLRNALQDIYPLDDEQRKRIADYSAWIEPVVLDAITQAFTNRSPATLWAGEGRATFAFNRRTNNESELAGMIQRGEAPKGSSDFTVPVLAVRSPGGKLRTVVFGYAAHASALTENYLWSADYAGVTRRVLESGHPGATAMFFQGCGSDQSAVPRGTVERCRALGESLAVAVEDALKKPMRPVSSIFRAAFEFVPLDFDARPTTSELETIGRGTDYRARWARRLARELGEGKEFERGYPEYPVQVWRLGAEQLWIALGGEVCVDYALRFQKEFGPGTWVTGYADDVMAYIPSRRLWEEGGYQAGAFEVYGLPATRWCPDIEDRIAQAVNRLVTQVRSSGVVSWPAPAGEPFSEHYELTVDSQPVPVYACRVSAVPFNQVWPGYQRPLDQTELGGFACWDMAGPVKVVVQSRRPVQSVVVRPASLGIRPAIQANRLSFSLERPGPVIVEVNGPQNALHLFASPPEPDVPAPDAPGVRYFGPGVHHVGKLELKSNETVFIAGGAVVYGSLNAHSASKIRISGRGVLDVSPFPRGEGGGAVRLSDCSDVTVEGIVMRDPDVWCCSVFGCRNVTIAYVKLVGLWRYNADGIDVCNSQDVEVRDCFVRAFDDALVIKGLKFGKDSFDERPVQNVRFRRCVVWCDWGRAMEIGAETCAPEIASIVFQDCDIVRTTHIAMDIQHGDRAAIRDVRFENIRVEIDDRNRQPRMQSSREEKYQADPESPYCPRLMEIVIRKNTYSRDEQRGTVQDVLFADIAVTSPHAPASSFRGFDAEHGVGGVTIANLRFNGQPVHSASEARLQIGPNVHNVHFAATAAPSKAH